GHFVCDWRSLESWVSKNGQRQSETERPGKTQQRGRQGVKEKGTRARTVSEFSAVATSSCSGNQKGERGYAWDGTSKTIGETGHSRTFPDILQPWRAWRFWRVPSPVPRAPTRGGAWLPRVRCAHPGLQSAAPSGAHERTATCAPP